MSEGVLYDIPLCLFLYPLVTDGTGGRQAFLDMASLQDLPRPVGIVRPDYGEAVGQKLHANLDGVGFLAAGVLLKVSHLTRDPERRLHVVTDLVGDDIGLGEIAGCVKTVRQILKKCQILVFDFSGSLFRHDDRDP